MTTTTDTIADMTHGQLVAEVRALRSAATFAERLAAIEARLDQLDAWRQDPVVDTLTARRIHVTCTPGADLAEEHASVDIEAFPYFAQMAVAADTSGVSSAVCIAAGADDADFDADAVVQTWWGGSSSAGLVAREIGASVEVAQPGQRRAVLAGPE